MPLLRREPEIWPPHLFGEPDGAAPDPAVARAAAAIHRRGFDLINGSGAAAGNGNGHGHDLENGNGHRGHVGRVDHWWVAYTLARQEKALARHLLHWQVPYYLPQSERRLRAGDRWRTSYSPLFTGYVFFHGDLHDRRVALRSNAIARLIPAPEPNELTTQLRSLWLLQTSGAPLVPHPYLGPGDEVEIVDGPLRGYRGVVEREKGKYRLIVSISLLRQSVAAEVPRDALVPASLRRVTPRTSPSAAALPRAAGFARI